MNHSVFRFAFFFLVCSACGGSSSVTFPGTNGSNAVDAGAIAPTNGDTIEDASSSTPVSPAPTPGSSEQDATAPASPVDPPVSVPDAAPVADAAVPFDATLPFDAGIGAPLLRCGGAPYNEVECYAATQTCCATSTGTGFTYGCVASASQCGGLPIGCASSADCDTDSVCCDLVVGGRETVSCMTASLCTGRLLCEGGGCPATLTCTPYGNGVPYSVCQ